MSNVVLNRLTKLILLSLVLMVAVKGFAADWVLLGPEGGDVRSLTFDPHNPDRILLGTSAGQLFQSTNGGQSWARFAHLGEGDDYVLDNVIFDPNDSNVIYVAAWSVENQTTGDLFKSKDGGRSWELVPAMRGKSIRALALAPSNPKMLVAGALDGVFRSMDGGNSWRQISPPNHADIRNIESIAIDPKDPGVIYAGTWHLPWKTTDGGANWHNIKTGMIDDSDVFSIIIDHSNNSTVYLSACSGIYKSENGGELFHKIQGIPGTARRTRVLQQDPLLANVVYAGTTEGLWKTVDGGRTFKRMSPPNFIVNDVMVDPRNSNRVLVATDRNGVVVSNDATMTFASANRGFSHRQVSSIAVDRKDSSTLYAALVNDKEFGGVFTSRNGGSSWQQMSEGLGGRDVFSIDEAANGTLVAGTNKGVFMLDGGRQWKPINTVVKETAGKPTKVKKGKKYVTIAGKPVVVKSEISSRVAQVDVSAKEWYAASGSGLYVSKNEGKSWTAALTGPDAMFVSVQATGDLAVAATATKIYSSTDGGESWSQTKMPSFISRVYAVTVSPDGTLWMASREGAFRSKDRGNNWEHAMGGLPARNILSFVSDGRRMLATAWGARGVFESNDNGQTWKVSPDSGMSLRHAVVYRGHVLAASAFNGLVMQSGTEAASVGNEPSPRGGAAK